MSSKQRISLVNKEEKELSMVKQCELLSVNRSSVYYLEAPRVTDEATMMNLIKEVWLELPMYGYRRITKELKNRGVKINRKRVQRLMQVMGIKAIYPGPNTSKRNQAHAVYPYLLRGMEIERVNQVWQVDITYLKINGGFMYLVAIIDVYSRYIVSWELSNTLHTDFCIEALTSGLSLARPDIVNSDQGCQFTSEDWIQTLTEANVAISMDGVGRCLDNIYIERFWRTIKYEEVYMKCYNDVPELKREITKYIEFYNNKRLHQSLDYKTPAEIYFARETDPAPQPSDSVSDKSVDVKEIKSGNNGVTDSLKKAA